MHRPTVHLNIIIQYIMLQHVTCQRLCYHRGTAQCYKVEFCQLKYCTAVKTRKLCHHEDDREMC